MFSEVSSGEDASRALAVSTAKAVVAVPVYNAPLETSRCLRSILQETDPAVPVLVVDDGSHDRAALIELRELTSGGHSRERVVVVLNKPTNRGFVDSANLIFKVAGRSDIVLVNSDVEVAAGWLAGLESAAYSSNLVASASALSNCGGILSVPARSVPNSRPSLELPLQKTAERVRRGSGFLRARIPTAVGHCVYIRRMALDVVGNFDTIFAPGYEEEVDWSLRAASMGFEHVVADDVYVYHQGGASFGESSERREQQLRNLREVVRRYPYHLPHVRSVEADRSSSLAACLLAARRSISGLTVVVDGMCLGRHQTGTQTLVVHLTRALAQQERVAAIRLLVPGGLSEYAAGRLTDLQKLSIQPAVVGARSKSESADVVLRPYQFSSEAEVEWLRGNGERLAVVQLDLIAYNDPAYFPGYHQWQSYRDVQRLALTAADGVAFISDTIRRQAREIGLLPESTPSCVAYLGIDEQPEQEGSDSRPSGCESVADGFLLVLGASFLHKNRVWAIELVQELVSAGWTGHLILAGPTPSYGSSRQVEEDYLSDHLELRGRVVDVGSVSPSEKHWLYCHAGLVLYPTVSEGFGMIPFEAADAGTPCLSTRQGSLSEVLPEDLQTLDSFALTPARDLVLKILSDQGLSQGMVSSVEAQRAKYSWRAASEEITDLLWAVTARPRSKVAAIEGARGQLTLRATPREQPLRRLIDPLAAMARESKNVQDWILPPGTRRGYISRRAYHKLAGDERPRRRRKPS